MSVCFIIWSDSDADSKIFVTLGFGLLLYSFIVFKEYVLMCLLKSKFLMLNMFGSLQMGTIRRMLSSWMWHRVKLV
jgi:hypothetical protein